MIGTEHLLDDERFHAVLSDNTIHNATSTAHGLLPKLKGITAPQEFLASTGGWAMLNQWFAFSTSAGTLMQTPYLNSGTVYSNPLAAGTTYMYPVFELVIPPFVQKSRVEITMLMGACSTGVVGSGNSGFYLKSGRGCMQSSCGIPLGASTRYWEIPGMIKFFAVNTGTSGYTSLSTEIEIVGGEVFTLYALSTESQIRVEQIALIGDAAGVVTPSQSTMGRFLVLTTNF